MDTLDSFVGIDVSKARLDVHVRPDDDAFAVGNDAPGLAELLDRLAGLGTCLVVLEATGGLQERAAAALAEAGLAVAVVNPRQVRDFARATGQLAKTDRLDARVIARFAEAVRPAARPLADDAHRALVALIARRRQLVEMRMTEKLRRPQTAGAVRRRLDEHLAWLSEAIVELDAEIRRTIRQSPVWRADDDLLASIPGIGTLTRALLLARLPELARADRRSLAALVGLAPMNRDSGQWRGRRTIQGGRADIRRVLYMATVAAIRCNPVIRAFHRLLIEAGKPQKVAIIAAMRKLLTIAAAILKSRQPWKSA